MSNKSINHIIFFVLIVAVLALGYSIYTKSKYISYDSTLSKTKGKIIAKIIRKNLFSNCFITWK